MNKAILLKQVNLNQQLCDVLIVGTRFAKIAPQIAVPPDAEVIDGTDLALVAPFYNTHTHAAMTLLRGYADDMELFKWLNDYIWPLEAKLTPEDIYWGTKLAILEMIKTGTVFFADMYWHAMETARAAEDMGIRANIGLLRLNCADAQLRQNAELLDKYGTQNSGLISLSLAPHAIYTCDEATLKATAQAAQEMGLRVHIHVAETQKEFADCQKAHGTTPFAYLDRLGLVNERLIAAHGACVTDAEIQLLAQKGSTIAHCPTSNMKLCSGILRYTDLQSAGVRVSLGTDGCASNNNLSMFSEMKIAALRAKEHSGSPETAPAVAIYQMASANGAAAFGLDAGVIAEGKLADALLINLRHHLLVADYHLPSNLVYSAGEEAVDTVICNGKILMRHRRVEGEEEIIDRTLSCVRRLAQK